MNAMKKRICILGSTGSVGKNALKVAKSLGSRLEVCALAAKSSGTLLLRQAKEFGVKEIAIADKEEARVLSKRVAGKMRIFAGKEGIVHLAACSKADIVLMAISGAGSVRSTYAAVSAGKDIALASKEALVAAGRIITETAKRKGARVLPVDSEHCAIHQCIEGRGRSDVKKLIITATGGPFLDLPRAQLKYIKPEDALKHPKWRMGKKISIDSATMINKGLEVIEASWLFGVDVKDIEVLIHPEAIVHSMVEFIDGSVIAQLGITDMRLPIQYALTYPRRYDSILKKLDLADIKQLTFRKPDRKKFPLLGLSYEAGVKGGSSGCALSAANEACVNAFLAGEINFGDISRIVEKVMSRHRVIKRPDLRQIEEISRWAVDEVKKCY